MFQPIWGQGRGIGLALAGERWNTGSAVEWRESTDRAAPPDLAEV